MLQVKICRLYSSPINRIFPRDLNREKVLLLRERDREEGKKRKQTKKRNEKKEKERKKERKKENKNSKNGINADCY